MRGGFPAVNLLFVLPTIVASAFLALPALAGEPASLRITGDWQVEVTANHSAVQPGGELRTLRTTVDIAPARILTIQAEKHDTLPVFNPNAGGWAKGAGLRGVRAQECTTLHLLDPSSLKLHSGAGADSLLLKAGKDYGVDLAWGTFGRLTGGRIQERQPVYASYVCGELRLDSVVLTREGRIVVRQGEGRSAAPVMPPLAEGDQRLANVWLPGRVDKLTPDLLFPILETTYPEPPKPTSTTAERLLPATLRKLRDGQALRVLAWGDSVTDGSYVPDSKRDRWQAQFVARLAAHFPQARIELVTEAWGGRNTDSYLNEPPGSPHNYQEKVLAAKPDLIVSEFVNDAGLNPEQVEQRYGKLLADFKGNGAEWIILTPHYVRPDWMGLNRERDIDDDPRPYVKGLRAFAEKHQVALADASLRYGRLWRQGIPYTTLMLNSINHPDARGMGLFADSLMQLFP
jgi:lysophospholipase L1-like esterase